jgi:hypothetical protein
MTKRILLILLISLFLSFNLFSIDFWQHPEMAEKGTIFTGAFAASFAFSLTKLSDWRFKIYNPEIFFDFMLPVPLPFSFGVSVSSLKSGVFGIGFRPAYHINLNDPNSDLYVMYPINIEFVEDISAKLEYTGRIGFRRRFGSFFCVNLETGFMLKALNFGIAIKLN